MEKPITLEVAKSVVIDHLNRYHYLGSTEQSDIENSMYWDEEGQCWSLDEGLFMSEYEHVYIYRDLVEIWEERRKLGDKDPQMTIQKMLDGGLLQPFLDRALCSWWLYYC